MDTNKNNHRIVLVTGANAMDSKELTHIHLSRGNTVILTYRRSTTLNLQDIRNLFKKELLENPTARLDFEFCDITDQNSVITCIKNTLNKYGKIDHIYMIAAMSHVGQSFFQKDYSIIANGQSYYYFLEAVKSYTKETRVYGALTSELAGNVIYGNMFDEETPWNPKSPYSYGKALGGHWIKHYRESSDSNLFCCFGLLFNHSSAAYRTSDFFIRKLTNSFAKIALGKQEFVEFGFLDFWRDEGYASFYCEQMINMLDNPRGPIDYVIATGTAHHAEEYLDLAAKYFNLDWKKVVRVNDSLKRSNEVVRLVGDSSKAQKDFGFNPNRMPFKDHIDLMCKYDYEMELGERPDRPDVFKLYP